MSTSEVWRKSNRSGPGNSCVEVSSTLSRVRDSKNPTGPTLHANLPALLTVIKSGRLDA